MTVTQQAPRNPPRPTNEPPPDVLGPMLIISAALLGVGMLFKLTESLAVTAIAAVLAGVLGTVAQARRVYHYYRVRHWD